MTTPPTDVPSETAELSGDSVRTRRTYVLVHGSWGDPWVWDDVAAHLEDAGHATVAVDLPTSGADPQALGGLADDAVTVRAALDAAAHDVVLVGHSWGGMVVTEVADHPAIHRSVYVAAAWPPRGASLMDLLGDGPLPPAVVPRDDGSLAISKEPEDLEAAHLGFAADMDVEAYDERIRQRLVLMNGAALADPSSAPDRDHPVTYVIATQDRALLTEAQEQMASAADDVVRIDASHCLLWTTPGELGRVLLDAAA